MRIDRSRIKKSTSEVVSSFCILKLRVILFQLRPFFAGLWILSDSVDVSQELENVDPGPQGTRAYQNFHSSLHLHKPVSTIYLSGDCSYGIVDVSEYHHAHASVHHLVV